MPLRAPKNGDCPANANPIAYSDSAATSEAEMVVRLQSRSGAKYICELDPGEDWRMLPDGTIVIAGPSGVFYVQDGKRREIKPTGHEGHVTVNFDRWGRVS